MVSTALNGARCEAWDRMQGVGPESVLKHRLRPTPVLKH